VFANLKFNGKSALENGELYRQIVVSDPAHAGDVVKSLVDFAPHVVLFAGGDLTDPVLAPLEAAWPAARPRPYFVATGSLVGETLFRFIGAEPKRRVRFFGVAPSSTTMANARLTMRYDEVYGGKLSPASSPAASYDAFYLVGYAAIAAKKDGPSGTDLAAAISSLLPPGPRVEVGPTHVLEGVDALRVGGRVDLAGIMTTLDFDVKSGETTGDLVITCVGAGAGGSLSEVDSGLRYDAAAGKIVGELRCP
jgi:hypothetical protein